MIPRPRATRFPVIVTLAAVLVLASWTAAQRRALLSVAPALDPIVPPGGQRGTTVDIALTGANLADPLAIWTSAPGGITFPTDSVPRKDSTNSRVRMNLTADAAVGWHRLRLSTAHGLTNARPFCVDALPQIVETDSNHTTSAAQSVPLPCVVVGRAEPELSDYFKISVGANQRVSFEVLGRRLGSSFDPVIRLHDVRAGRDIPGAMSDDAPGLQTDARLTYTFATAGDYLVEIRDTTHKGGKDFWYRLRIGDFPCALAPLPLAAKRGTKVTVQFVGPNIEGAAPVEVQAPTDPAIESIPVIPVGANGVPGWPVELLLSDHDELLSPSTMQTPTAPVRLNVPSGVTGRFQRRSQKDQYVFAAKKGQALQIAAQTAEVHSPTDVLLTVLDAKGAIVGTSNPDASPRIDFTAQADGDFTVVAEHLNYSYGPTEFYRLTVRPRTPTFELALAADRLDVPQGQLALLPLQYLTRLGYGGPIDVSVVGPAGLSGSVKVPENAQSPPAAAGQPEPPAAALLPVRATADLAPGPYEIMVRATAVIDGKEFVTFASTKPAVSRDLGNLSVPPRSWLRGVGVGVLTKPPFTLTAKWERPEAVRGLSAKLVVTATRDAGFDGAIALTVGDLPANVSAGPQTVAKDKTDATFDVQLKEAAPLGTFPFSVVGRSTRDGREYAAVVLPPPLVVAVPFDLAVEPNPLTLTAGEKDKLTVRAVRKGGYIGPVTLEFRNLPANVTVPKAAIAKEQDHVEVELTAAGNAALGVRGDVSVLGTAPLGNQQAASPNFTVGVQAPPAALALKADPAVVTLKPGAPATIKVAVERKYVAGPVALTVEGLPAKVTAAPVTVAADKNEAVIDVTAAADAMPGKAEATIKGQAGMAVGTVKITVQIEK